MKRPTPEQIEKLKLMKTEEDLIAFAKENGVDLYNTDIRTRYEWTFKYTGIRLTPRPNKLLPDIKYVYSAYRFYGDYGTRYDPVPKGRVMYRIFGVDFLVRKKRLPLLKRNLKNPKIRHFLANHVLYFNHCAMFIGIDNEGKPYITSSAIIHEPERFCVNGVNVVTEKGAFDLNDRKDKALLRKLTNHYINQRVKLDYWGERHGGYTDFRTTCIIPYRIMDGSPYDYFMECLLMS